MTSSTHRSWTSQKLSSTQIPHAKFILVPISDATRGHGTHTVASVWKQYLIDFLSQTEKNQSEKK